MANEFDQYTIKYNTEFKDFKQSALPKVGRGSVLGIAGAVAGAGLSLVFPFGAVIGAGVGFALAGPASQIAYSSVYSAQNLSKRHFSKVKLPLEDATALGVRDDNAKRNILAVKMIAEACDKRARDYVAILNNPIVGKKYTIVDADGKTIQVGERKLKKLIKENEEIARHALDYMMDIAVEQSSRYRAVEAGSLKVADKQSAIEFCMYMLQTAGQTASNLVGSRRTLGDVNPYKGTILRAMERKALIGTVNGKLQPLPMHDITHTNPSFNERIELNAGNAENLLVLYNEIFETQIRNTLQREQEQKNAEQLRIDVDTRNQIARIEQYIKTLKQGENFKQAKNKLDVYLRNNLDVAVLIGIAQRVKIKLPHDKQIELDEAIAVLVDANTNRKVTPIAQAKLTLATLIEEAYGVIETTKFNEGAQSRQAEIDDLLTQLTAGEINRSHLASLVDAYSRIIAKLKRASAEDRASAETDYLKLKAAYEASGAKNKELEKIISQLEQELDIAKSKKRDLHLQHQENLQKARQMLGARNDNILSQAEQIKLLIAESEGKTLSIQSLKQAVTMLSNELSKAAHNARDDKSVIDQYRAEVANLTAELEQLKIANPKQSKQIAELQALLAKREIELKNAILASKKYQSKTAEAKKANTVLEQKAQQTEAKLKQEIVDERARSSQNLKVAAEQLSKQKREQGTASANKEKILKSVIAKLRKSLNKNNITIEDLQHVVEKLKAINAESEVEKLELQDQIDALVDAIAGKEQELADFKSSVVNALNRYRSSSQETIAMQYEQFANIYKQMGIKDDRAEELLGRLHEAMEKASTSAPVTKATVLSGIKEMWGENFALLIHNTDMYEDIMARLREQFNTAEQKAKKQAERARKAEKRARDTKTQLSEERSRFERELAEVTADSESLRGALQSANDEIDSLNETNAELNTALDSERAQKAKIEAGKFRAERDVAYFAAEALRQKDRADQAIIGAEEMYEQQVEVVDELYAQIDGLLTEMAEKDAEVKELRGKVDDLTDTFVHSPLEMRLGKAKKSLQKSCDELRGAIDTSIKSSELDQVRQHAEKTLFAIDALDASNVTYYVDGLDGRNERYFTDEEIEGYIKAFTELSKQARGLTTKISKINAKLF